LKPTAAGPWRAARVILAFSGEGRDLREEIREWAFQLSIAEREREVSSVAAPVFGLNWALLGSLCISGPTSRLTKAKLQAHATNVIRAANQLSYALAGGKSAQTPAAVSRWHPQRLRVPTVASFAADGSSFKAKDVVECIPL
jgi:hypothetical protein